MFPASDCEWLLIFAVGRVAPADIANMRANMNYIPVCIFVFRLAGVSQIDVRATTV